MAALAIVGAIGSGVMGAMAARQQGEAAAAAAEQNARIQDYNKQVALRNRDTVLAQTEREAENKMRDNRRQLASVRAAYGASGLALSGSPLDVIEDSALEQSLDVATMRYKGKVQAAGYTDEAENFNLKSRLYRMESANASKAGKISAIASYFGAASSVGTTMMKAA